MSAASTLPFLIIQSILRHSIGNAQQSKDFKANLRLLAICHCWREFAMPWVYKDVFFSLSSPFSSGFNYGIVSGYTRTAIGQTNVGLVQAMRVSTLVRTLKIQITDKSANVDNFIDCAQKMLDYNDHSWLNIRELCIHVRVVIQEHNALDAENRQKIIDSAKMFATAIPNIENLTVYVNSTNNACLFVKTLVDIYVLQLKSCVLEPFSNFASCFANMNAVQRIRVRSHLLNRNQKAFLNPQSLTHLELIDNGAANMWTRHLLGHFLSKQRAVYPRLESLMLTTGTGSLSMPEISKNAPNAKQIRSIEFPALKSVQLIFSSLEGLVDTLCNSACIWPAVTTLHLILHPFYRCSLSVDDIDSRVQELCASLGKSMPCLNSVYIENRAGGLAKILQDCIFDCLSDKITHFSSCKPLFIRNPVVTTSLVSLTIVANKIMVFHLIAANRKTLKYLTTLNVPHTFKWSLLMSMPSDTLLFPQLRHLEMYFIADDNEIRRPSFLNPTSSCSEASILFPRLSEIKLFPERYSTVSRVLTDNCTDIKGTRKLAITLQRSLSHAEQFQSADNFGNLKTALWLAMPNIVHLILKGKKTTDATLFDVINQVYCHQLQHLSSSTTSLNKLRFSPNIQSLALYSSGHPMPLSSAPDRPSISINNLQELELTTDFDHFSWNWFKDGQNVDKLCFDNLKSLRIKITASNNAYYIVDNCVHSQSIVPCKSQRPIDIFMPKVTNFYMELPCTWPDRTPSQIHFSAIDYVKLTGPVGALPICASKNSVVMEYQDINISGAALNDNDYFYLFTNSWFGNRQPLSNCSLVISDIEFGIEPERLNWRYVDNMTCNFEMNVQTLFEIIPQLSNLDSLVINRFSIEDDLEFLPEISMQVAVRPLSTSVKSINFKFMSSVNNVKHSERVLSYLILALPFLESIGICGVEFNSNAFVKAYEKTHLHVILVDISTIVA